MLKRKQFLAASLTIAISILAVPAVAQVSPTPTPSPSPKPFNFSGYARSFDFTRQNAYSGYSAANQQTFNTAISLHGDYTFLKTGFNAGASYLYANPIAAPSLHPDNTVPDFELSTLYEAYLQYEANGLYGKVGDQVINTPWALSADTRLKPVAFRGADVSYTSSHAFVFEASDYVQWECRTCSDFDKGTLLTTAPVGYAGANALPPNNYDPSHSTLASDGFLYGRLGFLGTTRLPLTANVYYYSFQNIANVVWGDAKYTLSIPLKPFVALQGGTESKSGHSYLGNIRSTIFGAQFGFNPLHDVTLIGGYDGIPVRTATVTLPSGFKCTPTRTISSPTNWSGNLPYFLPIDGTGNCSPNPSGTTNIYYGGWAGPYSYTTDVLFTTSLTQGLVSRRSPGSAFKVQATYTSSDRHFIGYVTQAWYDYNNDAYAQSTRETDLDLWYFFRRIPKSGHYRGFSLRWRYGARDESPTFDGFSGVALFKYNRFQAEYDF
jgi:hypothetical protein